MAFITLQGNLLDPNGDLASGDQLRFTHKSTTGKTLKSAVTLLKLTTKGNYYIDLQYGLVLVEYKDKRSNKFEKLGVVTVNETNPATTIPELLNAVAPVSSEELIEFQSILADTITAQNTAQGFADDAEDARDEAILAAQSAEDRVWNKATLADAQANSFALAGDSVNIKERTTGSGGGALWDYVADQALPLNVDTVNHDTINLQLVKRTNTSVETKLGATVSSEATKVFAPEKALFAFHYDGAYIDNFTILLDKADALGIPVCIGAIQTMTNGAPRGASEVAIWGYENMYIDAVKRGHEIYNHGYKSSINMKPDSDVDDPTLELWVNGSHKWLQSLGINAQVWVTSNGGGVIDQSPHLDPKYIPKILERHTIALGRTSSITNDVNGFLGTSYGADTNLNGEGLTRANIEGQTLDKVKEFIDYCIDNKRVAVFHNHDAGNAGQTPPERLEEIVDYIHSRGHEVVKSQDVFASFSNAFTEGGTSSKVANTTAVEKNIVFENLLPTSQIDEWVLIQGAGHTVVRADNHGSGRTNGTQNTIVINNPTVLNEVSTFYTVVNRPFNKSNSDNLTMSFDLSVSSGDDGDFGVEIILEYRELVGGAGALIKTERLGKVVYDEQSELELNANNFFSYSNVQSVIVKMQVANKTLWSGTKNLFVFNPTLNRGRGISKHIAKVTGTTLRSSVAWQGNVGTVSTITLDKSLLGSQFVKIEVGVNNANNDVRGSVLMAFTTHDVRIIRARSNDGATIYTDFEVRFLTDTTLEIISETVVGGGDFAVIGVYKY